MSYLENMAKKIIKKFILITDGSDVVLYPQIKDLVNKLNEVIDEVNILKKNEPIRHNNNQN